MNIRYLALLFALFCVVFAYYPVSAQDEGEDVEDEALEEPDVGDGKPKISRK